MRQKRSVRPEMRINPEHRRGQSLVEYALIAVLVAVAMIAALLLAGPSVGNVFTNPVYNALGQTALPYNTFSAQDITKMAAGIAQLTPATFPFSTNTPAAPTCSAPFPKGTWQTKMPTTIPPSYES